MRITERRDGLRQVVPKDHDSYRSRLSTGMDMSETKEKELPMLFIDVQNRIIDIGGRKRKVKGRIMWATILCLTGKGTQGIVPTADIVRVARWKGAKGTDKDVIENTIFVQRRFFRNYYGLTQFVVGVKKDGSELTGGRWPVQPQPLVGFRINARIIVIQGSLLREWVNQKAGSDYRSPKIAGGFGENGSVKALPQASVVKPSAETRMEGNRIGFSRSQIREMAEMIRVIAESNKKLFASDKIAALDRIIMELRDQKLPQGVRKLNEFRLGIVKALHSYWEEGAIFHPDLMENQEDYVKLTFLLLLLKKVVNKPEDLMADNNRR